MKRDFASSREVVGAALSVYIEQGLSVKLPVQCLDLSVKGVEGFKWIDTHGNSVKVTSSQSDSHGPEKKDLANSEVVETQYSLIERTDFNFIYIECTTEGSSYFDCVFRKIARNGIFAITTHDDPALYGRPSEPALRCYSGLIVRTFYAPEMAVRLIIAAMARSAARFSKSIEILLSFVNKNSITMIVMVKKGAESAVNCLKGIKSLVHCSVCEERAFLPDNDGFVVENVSQYLSCSCVSDNVGRTLMALGPLWAGSLGSVSFINSLLPQVEHLLQLTSSLLELITELRCEGKGTPTIGIPEETNFKDGCGNNILLPKSNSAKRSSSGEPQKKLRKIDNSTFEPAPVFYYNLHKHKPKGIENLVKANKIIEKLHKLNFRACRTHFDRAAIKTNASLRDLQKVMSDS